MDAPAGRIGLEHCALCRRDPMAKFHPTRMLRTSTIRRAFRFAPRGQCARSGSCGLAKNSPFSGWGQPSEGPRIYSSPSDVKRAERLALRGF